MNRKPNPYKSIFKTIALFSAVLLLHTNSFPQDNPRHSIGIGAGAVYLSEEEHFDPGLQLEYAYGFLWGNTPLNAGASVEMIFGEHRHIGLAFLLGYSSARGWDVGLGPGVMFEGDRHYFCINLATSYGFDLGRFAAGPAMELAHTGRHYHLLLGIQIDFDF
jgi:hypothetical protein